MSNSTIVNPNDVNLVFTGQSAIGTSKMMPSGLNLVTVTESSIRQNSKGLSLWLTMTGAGGQVVYDYISLPTPGAASQKTQYGNKAEFFERKLKATLLAFSENSEGINALSGEFTGQRLIEWTMGRKGYINYMQPAENRNGKREHQIDYVSQADIERAKSGELTFKDRRDLVQNTNTMSVVPTASAPMPAVREALPVTNGVTPQPPANTDLALGQIVGGNI